MSGVRIVWPEPPAHLELARNEVHVWAVPLTQPVSLAAKLAALLEEEERERAARFQFDHLRQSFRVSHGALRLILSRYANVAPERLRFAHGPFGKPELEPKSAVRFNLSHSGELALLAVNLEREIGVDVEALRAVSEAESIARGNFSSNEFAAFCGLDEKQKLSAFFNCWTRKEAFLKAHGAGLSMPLEHFEVAFAPNEPARLISIHGNARAAEQWTLCALSPADGYVAALAVESTNVKICCWRWSEDRGGEMEDSGSKKA
jgi:4'-phosphopantetheinyl transferase